MDDVDLNATIPVEFRLKDLYFLRTYLLQQLTSKRVKLQRSIEQRYMSDQEDIFELEKQLVIVQDAIDVYLRKVANESS